MPKYDPDITCPAAKPIHIFIRELQQKKSVENEHYYKFKTGNTNPQTNAANKPTYS